jgi:uncharacterized membrane protein YqjE
MTVDTDTTRGSNGIDAPGLPSGDSGGLVHSAINEATRLVTAEMHLARQEIAESLHAAVIGLITGTVAVFGIVAFLVMAIVTLVIAVPLHWVAALACAMVFLVIAIIAASLAVNRLKRISPLRQTVRTVKEDVEWAKLQLTPDKR